MDFNQLLANININLSEYQLKQFHDYFEFLVSYNEKVNLTAITEETEVYIKHFYDSLLLAKSIDLNEVKTLCDVGSGAGFPSIPLKIAFPHLKITIIDALDKRWVFLKELAKLLNLENIELVHSRAEDYAKAHREVFDVVTARAVARENILNELCIPLTRVDGHFISMKGKNADEELNEGKSLEILKGKIVDRKDYYLPEEESKRVLVVIKHYEKCPNKYPRAFGAIKKNPL